ncbi:MAG: hypothetical protein GY906_26005 [bacterium]|nr:hypothetical protein [bacterium]
MANADLTESCEVLAEEKGLITCELVTREEKAIASACKRFFEWPDSKLSCHPENSSVLDSGKLGICSGPVFDPMGERVGRFNSVWQKERSGAWKIVFMADFRDLKKGEKSQSGSRVEFR